MAVNLIKLSVGTRSIDGLAKWQRNARAKGPDGNPRHVTRMWPKREAEIVAGGSIYWVIKGVILCRQEVLRLDEVVRKDGIRRCGIVLRPGLTPVVPTPKKAFQGWRYLTAEDAPKDIDAERLHEMPLPPKLQMALAEIGVV
ncbi:DUF1489 domain-containing protein [Jannaschia sp. Os4]|uniref:DUF1489 family protein n=1 Tax=Jannaschia sp. Os4 TaxID=2807617 RepID=UPI00193942F5|nr:DUF1489 domain-containing protein [Jannaschia sp. Os4]MBM2575338.1 DUF1489 domain-containing protein [Jannaschia sp. Os4]